MVKELRVKKDFGREREGSGEYIGMQPAGAVPTHPLALLMDRTERWTYLG